MIYTNYEDLERDFKADIVTPQMLKQAMSKLMNQLLEISNEATNQEDWNIILKAREIKSKKRVKNLILDQVF